VVEADLQVKAKARQSQGLRINKLRGLLGKLKECGVYEKIEKVPVQELQRRVRKLESQ